MLTLDDYRRIRRARAGRVDIPAIARALHHSRRAIREALATSQIGDGFPMSLPGSMNSVFTPTRSSHFRATCALAEPRIHSRIHR